MDHEIADVAVVGPGAIGCAFAAAAAQAGQTLVFGARTSFETLHAEFPDTEVRLDAVVHTDPVLARAAPLVLLATKTHQTLDAAPWLAGFAGEGSIVVALQNGVDHVARVQPLLPTGAELLPAVVACPAERPAPGEVRVSGAAQLFVPEGDAATRFTAAMAGSVADIVAVDDWLTVAWTKLLSNAANGAVGVLARRGNEVFEDAEAAALSLALMEETAAVGRAEGAQLSADLPAKIQEVVRARAGRHVSSIVADRLAGRPTEWRDRNEVVVRAAERHGIDVPLTRAMTTLVRLGEPQHEG